MVDIKDGANGTTANDIQVGGQHYKTMPIQPWEVMEAVLTHEEFVGFLKGNVLKYGSRLGKKGDTEIDAGKLSWYALKLRDVLSVTQ